MNLGAKVEPWRKFVAKDGPPVHIHQPCLQNMLTLSITIMVCNFSLIDIVRKLWMEL